MREETTAASTRITIMDANIAALCTATTPTAKRLKMRLRSMNMFSTAMSTEPSGPRSASEEPHTDTHVVEATHCRFAASDTMVDTKKQNCRKADVCGGTSNSTSAATAKPASTAAWVPTAAKLS
eukprot:CAMPEP_0118925792 /NCGR_PEP_ID=MMETSP1169-20130426/3616_1 /TAXON_ID=36882 /ORGANISM="Pyramimonas obovata, Strain CCMP722" /LENGTH=123 /DNA_ID=CAMNT_0006867185 /DNA_START=752 /DNA_END=1123 /DNA_ORIENTATION=-